MHQDSLRSVVYRSFVTCDDPKGVVECGTIRRSKSRSQKIEHKIKSQKPKKNLDASLSHKAEKKEEMAPQGIAEEFHSPSSFQLMEVSRGAQRLNEMIDSWSKGKNNESQSKDVAKDLLKGALDLQESLMMLGKLQEASQYMSKLKKKQKEKSKEVRNGEVGIERSNSYQFGDRKYQMGFQNPRLSVDGPSRDCFEELREAIRDGLARQNLLPNSDTEARMGLHRRSLDSASEIPSTSSSQTSTSHANNYSSSDSPFSSSAPEKKAKGPNLIAKLMGLEEIPSKPLEPTLQKQLKDEKISSHHRPIFEIDMPKVRKPQSIGLQRHPERRTLKEILETLHFTGLLKSKSVEEIKGYPDYHTSNSHSKQRLIDNSAPIVLIKPLRGPFQESEEPYLPMLQEHCFQDTKMMLKKPKVKDDLPSTTINQKEEHWKPRNTSRKTEAEDSAGHGQRLSKLEGVKESNKIAGKAEEKEVKIVKKGPRRMNASVNITSKPRKMEALDPKADKNPKVMGTSRKTQEKEIVNNSKNVASSKEQAKAVAVKVRKPKIGSNITTNQIPPRRNSTLNATPSRTKQNVNRSLNDKKRSMVKKEKPVSKPTAANLKLSNDNIGSEDDEKRIDISRENDFIQIGNESTDVGQLPELEETETFDNIEENCNNSHNSLCDAAPLSSEHEKDPEFIEEVNNDISCVRMDSKSLESGTNLKVLLSSSPTFLGQAEELFDLSVNGLTTSGISAIMDFLNTDERVSMDCANELIERRSLPDSKMVHPLLLNWLRNSRICISLSQLFDEIHRGVETLRSYSKLAGENLSIDSIYAMLESDINCKGVVSGIWEMGWRNEFSTDDAEQVVNDIEKLLLSGLIDEFFA